VVSIYAQELVRRGHRVCLVSPPARRPSTKERVKHWLKGNGCLKVETMQPSHLDKLHLDHRVLDIWRPVEDKDVPDADVVIATWWETAEWVSRLAPEKGAKVYFVQHHEVFPYLPTRSRETYRLPLHKIVVAQWLGRVMLEQYDDSVVDVVPNSVDHTQFFAAPRGKQPAPTVGLLYSTVEFKGMDVAFRALEIVARKRPDLRVVSFGSEPLQANLVPPGHFEFYHTPRQHELRDLYARVDVWLTASRSEGFNLPAMEAMACRTPVVATRTGWPDEAIIPGVNGFLAGIDDAESLASAVEQILDSNDTNWKQLSASAYATVIDSSWENSTTMFEHALAHALERTARGEFVSLN